MRDRLECHPHPEAQTCIELRGVCHRYDDDHHNPLDDIHLRVQQGSIHFLLGPSGSGKTTLLRLIAGLESLQRGEILIDGVSSGGVSVDRRKVSFVFQDHALFPNLTARENVAYGLRGRRRNHVARVDALIMRFGLDAVADRYPHQLSGGQQQRVGIARAVIGNPAIVLFDEPFSSLDERTKDQTRDDVLHLLKATRSSALIVSHDPSDALHVADEITLLDPQGRVAQQGTPEEIFYDPQSLFVAEFMSEVNTVPGHYTARGFETAFGEIRRDHDQPVGREGILTVRPEGLSLLPEKEEGLTPGFAQVVVSRMLGSTSLVHLRTTTADSRELHIHARQPGIYLPESGSIHRMIINPRMAHIFPK